MLVYLGLSCVVQLQYSEFRFFLKKKENYLQPSSLLMTSDNDFVVFVCCVDIPLPYKHNGNPDVLQFALSCMSISHYKSSKYEKNIKNLKLFK